MPRKASGKSETRQARRAKPPPAPRVFENLVDRYLRWRWKSSPLTATYEGIHDEDARLDVMEADALLDAARQRRKFLDELEALEDPPASETERVDREVLDMTLRGSVMDLEEVRAWERDPSLYPQAALGGIFLLTVREFAPLEERLESILGRLGEVPRLLDEGRRNLKDVPSVFAKTALAVAQAGVAFFGETLPALAASARKPPPALRGAAEQAAEAMSAYARFLESAVLPGARGTFALGRRLFEEKLRYDHALEQTADDLWAFGQEAVREAEEELEKAARAIDPGQPWRALVSQWKREHPKPDALLAAYRTEMERARAFVADHDLATLPERERLDVIPTPAFDRPTTPYAALMPPAPFEKDQKSLFYVTPVEDSMPAAEQEERLEGHSLHGIPVTASHEAYPGHHLQLSRANAHPSRLRRTFGTPLLIEGWGLYSEEVMFEQGFFPDPRVRFFQLKDVLWRACRIVVDVGLHTRGMRDDEAVAYLVERGGLERPNARAEVNRYCANPTYQLCYSMGKAEILRLRDEVRRRRGIRFSLKEFHDRLLSYGSLSPVVIAREMLRDTEPS